jgi:hypothetical protein
MGRFRISPRTIFSLHISVPLLACALLFPMQGHAKKKPAMATVRWTAGAPGCTFARGDDGRFRWTMSDKNLDVTLLVDSQELTKSSKHCPGRRLFAAYLSVNFKGTGNFEFPADLRLQFLRHHEVLAGSLDPTDLQSSLQNDLDTLVFDTEREIKKHPAEKDEKTKFLQIYQKEGAEFIEFLTSQYLQPSTLNPGNPETHGWVLFGTSNKWIGPWKEHEDFVLEVLMKDRIYQFPFSLPPPPDELILRKPPE